ADAAPPAAHPCGQAAVVDVEGDREGDAAAPAPPAVAMAGASVLAGAVPSRAGCRSPAETGGAPRPAATVFWFRRVGPRVTAATEPMIRSSTAAATSHR